MTGKRAFKWLHRSLLLALLIFQIVLVIFCGMKKEGYHMDELFTYGLSNSYEKPVPSDSEQWLSPAYFHDYLEVGDNDAFAYKSVYDNQTKDVHPPLYYFLVHTISSFMPHTFSKWIGISVNILFFTGSYMMLYLLARRVLRREWLALLVCFFWGCSIGALSISIFIRMYMMLSFWILLSSYLFVRAMQTPLWKTRRKIYLALGLISFLGFFTQYFFIIYLVLASLVYEIYLWRSHLKRDRWFFLLSVLIGSFAVVVVFPSCLEQIFFSNRGLNNMGHFTLLSLFQELWSFVELVNKNLFGGILAYLLLGLAIIAIILLCKDRGSLKPCSGYKTPCMIVLPALGYLFLVVKAAPFTELRYVFPVFSLFALSFVGTLTFLARRCPIPQKARQASVAILTILVVFLGFGFQTVSFQYRGYAETQRTLQAYSDQRCILIADAPWELVGSCLELERYQAVYFHETIKPYYFSLPPKEEIPSGKWIAYIDRSYNQKKAVQMIRKTVPGAEVNRICVTDNFEIYEVK